MVSHAHNVLLAKGNVVACCNEFVNFLTCWKRCSAKAKLVVGQLAEILVSLVFAKLEHVEHVLALLELMLHFLSLEVFCLQDTPLKVKFLLHFQHLFSVSVVLGLLKHDFVPLLVKFLAGRQNKLVLFFKLDFLLRQLCALSVHLLLVGDQELSFLFKHALILSEFDLTVCDFLLFIFDVGLLDLDFFQKSFFLFGLELFFLGV